MKSTNSRNVLVFVDWFEPGYRAGGPIRSVANLVDRLDDLNFSVITSNSDHHDNTAYQGIEPGVWIKRNDHVRVMYLSPEQQNQSFLKAVIAAKKYDAVYLNSLFSYPFSIMPLRWLKKSKYSGRIVLAPRGMLKKGALSIKPTKKIIFLFASRITGLFKNIVWHATNKEEKKEILKHFGAKAKVKIAPNLINSGRSTHLKSPKSKGVLNLVSVARVSPEKNVLQSLEFLRTVHQKGQIHYAIFGTLQNPEYLAECKAVADELKHVEVTFHGPLPYNQIPECIAKSDFFYLPTLGENFGHSIVESLLTATPVIISDKTPWRQLENQKAGWDLKLDGIVFSQVLNHCLDMESEEYAELSAGALALGQRIADNKEHLRQNRELFRY